MTKISLLIMGNTGISQRIDYVYDNGIIYGLLTSPITSYIKNYNKGRCERVEHKLNGIMQIPNNLYFRRQLQRFHKVHHPFNPRQALLMYINRAINITSDWGPNARMQDHQVKFRDDLMQAFNKFKNTKDLVDIRKLTM